MIRDYVTVCCTLFGFTELLWLKLVPRLDAVVLLMLSALINLTLSLALKNSMVCARILGEPRL